MKLKFVDQQYQTDAVNAICDIFDGQQRQDSPFTIDMSLTSEYSSLFLEKTSFNYEMGHGNKLNLSDYSLLQNVRQIQETNDIQMSENINGRNFTIEMETGTGKTFVYTKTILELNKRYGFTKFIIVVPSIAIKEGVNNSILATREYFEDKYDHVVYDSFVYNSKHPDIIRDFAMSTDIQIMIINIDAFRKDVDEENPKKGNIINRESEKLSGNKPIDLIASTNPIVIEDEPQSIDNTEKAKAAIRKLNPLCILRYSATHKELYNLMYRLTPVDAYQQGLVKHIEVASVMNNDATAKAYVKLFSVDSKTYTARLEISVFNKKTGGIEKKAVKVRNNDDLWELSKEVDYYKDQNYIVDNIDCFEGEECVAFKNGETVHIGEAIGEINDEAIKRAQIRQTIEMHLDKETHLVKRGIKVLSLFFIDEVKNYRDYDREDGKGKYALWFEEEYAKAVSNPKYKKLFETYGDKLSRDPQAVHDGYFSKDGKGRLKNSTGKGISSDDETTYELIMQRKEELLSFDEPVRFIFSHSALKEGWDNPKEL